MNLVKYEATRQALIECATFDEVKTIKDKAQALANYARLSKDNELEKRSVEIRERARIRMGEMSLALPKKSPPGKAYSAEDTPTIVGVSISKTEALADAGISTQEASRAEKLAKKSKESQEAHVAKAVESVEKRNSHETKAHVANNSGENEWYTPPVYVDAARAAMGGIDVDPASCEAANAVVRARSFYTVETNGLAQAWGGNVWMNPPYAQPLVGQFIDKLISELDAGNVEQACVLVNNFTDTKAGQRLIIRADAVCFVAKRIKFIDKNGEESGAPLQGQMICYFGENAAGFYDEFDVLGAVLYR